MQKITIILFFTIFFIGTVLSGTMDDTVKPVREDYFKANYDETKVADYTLEDPLTFLDGSKVKNSSDWSRRRKEILGIFAREMFGQEPPVPETMLVENVEKDSVTLDGCALRSQYKMYFREDKTGPVIHWMLLRPMHVKGKVPVILFLNYRGNHALLNDPEIVIPERPADWPEYYQFQAKRGVKVDPAHRYHFPVQMILSAGYAVMSASYMDVSPDPESDEKNPAFQQQVFAFTGVFDLWGKRDESRTDNITSMGAWAWALSRGLDLAERIPELDAGRNIVTGCSRLAKAALLAAARDERFAVCVPIQCGGGGVTLAKRDFGENVATQMEMFSHWYCKAYKKYEKNPAKLLTFDQHLLVAAVAPRRLLVGGFDNEWFDMKGEYLACKAASPAWEICGKTGLPGESQPGAYELTAIGKDLGYYYRIGSHGIAAYDWWRLLHFAGFQPF